MHSFYSDKYNFWQVYETIKKFYPIGVQIDDNSAVNSYPGFQKLEAIISDSINDEQYFYNHWESWTNEISREINKLVIGTTYAQQPSFSSFVQLEISFLDTLTRTKELHFFVSLAGSFYSIIGQDINSVVVGGKTFRSTNYLVISPEEDFADAFRLLESKIEKKFAGYRFIPFDICYKEINGLFIGNPPVCPGLVFHALFGDQITLSSRVIGNRYYKYDDWRNTDYIDIDPGWTITGLNE
jgi:hypothetical protein